MTPEEIAGRIVSDWAPGWSRVGEEAIIGKIAEGVRMSTRTEREACLKVRVPIGRMNFSTLEREAAEWAIEEYRLHIRARPTP